MDKEYLDVHADERVKIVQPIQKLAGMILVEAKDGRQWFAMNLDRIEESPQPMRGDLE